MIESRKSLLKQVAIIDQKIAELEELVPTVADQELSHSLTEILARMRVRSELIEQLLNESKRELAAEEEISGARSDIAEQSDAETVRQATDESSRTERRPDAD